MSKNYSFPNCQKFNTITNNHTQTNFKMPKRKADSLSQLPSASGTKKTKHEPPQKIEKANLLDDSDSSDDSVGGAKLEESAFKINEEYAKKFEHNKKREELQRCRLFYPTTPNISNIIPSGGEIPKARKTQEWRIWRQV